MSVAQTAHSQFEQAYQLVAAINGPLARNEASGRSARIAARRREPAPPRPSRRRGCAAASTSLNSACASSRTLSVSWPSSANAGGKRYDIDDLETLHQGAGSAHRVAGRQRLQCSGAAHGAASELEQLQSRTQTLMRRAPVWLAAQNSLNQLCEQSGEQFASGRGGHRIPAAAAGA